MAVETLLALPRWVYVGVALGALASVGVAAVFLVAARHVPDGNRRPGSTPPTEALRRAEIREYLGAIGEAVVEDATVAGEGVAFYLPERDVAVTFDARAYLALEPTTTACILMEHELPGVALGRRLPFETPSVDGSTGDAGGIGRGPHGFGARQQDAQSREAACAVLGLSGDASEAALRRAYQERIKEVHPDHGGDEAEFRRVRDAYDAARRHV